MKGGKKMVEIQGEIYLEKCSFCGREFKSLYPKMAKSNKDIHELNCPLNPSNKENVKN